VSRTSAGRAPTNPRVERRVPCFRRNYAAVVLVLLCAGVAQGAAGRLAPICQAPSDIAGSLWVAADFDGDQSVDLARVSFLRPHGRAPAVHLFPLCPHSVQPIFAAAARIGPVLSARDVDADDDQDLVLRESIAGPVLGVWLNDGKGGFSPAEPSRFSRARDDPPVLENPPPRLHELAVFASSKAGLFVCLGPGFALPLPACSQGGPAISVQRASGWRSLRQSRAPPVLFF
jgi:hypothetical protein